MDPSLYKARDFHKSIRNSSASYFLAVCGRDVTDGRSDISYSGYRRYYAGKSTFSDFPDLGPVGCRVRYAVNVVGREFGHLLNDQRPIHAVNVAGA